MTALNTVTALDKAKTTYYEDTQALLRGEDSNVTKEQVDAIYSSLSPEDDKLFEQYRTEVDASVYPFLMKDFGPELRAAIDLFIKDGVQRISGEPKISDAERIEVLNKVPVAESFVALQLLDHPIVQAVIAKSLLDRGMTHDQIEERIAIMNAEEEAKTAVKAA